MDALQEVQTFSLCYGFHDIHDSQIIYTSRRNPDVSGNFLQCSTHDTDRPSVFFTLIYRYVLYTTYTVYSKFANQLGSFLTAVIYWSTEQFQLCWVQIKVDRWKHVYNLPLWARDAPKFNYDKRGKRWEIKELKPEEGTEVTASSGWVNVTLVSRLWPSSRLDSRLSD